jgi:hypothetical protein
MIPPDKIRHVPEIPAGTEKKRATGLLIAAACLKHNIAYM